MNPDASPLQRAIARPEEALALYQRDPSPTVIRDGLAHRLEFAPEIAHKLLRRYLITNAAAPDLISGMNVADIIRLGFGNDPLLGRWARWKTYRDMRARTGHSYNQAVALDGVAGIPAPLQEVRFLRDRLRDRAAE